MASGKLQIDEKTICPLLFSSALYETADPETGSALRAKGGSTVLTIDCGPST